MSNLVSQIKIFQKATREELEKEINDFLESKPYPDSLNLGYVNIKIQPMRGIVNDWTNFWWV